MQQDEGHGQGKGAALLQRAGGILHDRWLIAAIILGVAVSALAFLYTLQLQQIPAPLYGGDLYYQLGSIYHFYQNGPIAWLDSSSIPGTMPAYLPLYSAVVTLFGKPLSLDPLHATLYLNAVLPLCSVLLFFLLARELLGSGGLALVFAAALCPFNAFPMLKYTEFTTRILVPLFFLAALLFFKRKGMRSAALLGLSYAAMGLGHGTSFMYASAFVAALAAFMLWREGGRWQVGVKRLAPPFALAFGLGFLPSLLVWFAPIFIYHGASTLQNNVWGIPDVARLDVGLGLLKSQLLEMFLNTSGLFQLLLSLCSLAGVLCLAAKWRRRAEPEFGFMLFALPFTAAFIYSYFITAPLFNFHTVPTYSYAMYLVPLVALCGLLFLRERFAGTPHFKYALGILAAAFLLTSYFSYGAWQSGGQWLEVGKQPLDPMHASLRAYLLGSTGPNDIILSNNELSFSINAISGRKLVVSRRSHNSPFMDFDSRELAAAEIFYGNDPQRRASLLSQYNVSYVFFSQSWYQMEFSFDSQGRVTDYSDPLMVMSGKGAEAELDRYGVKYSSVRGYVDPALRGPEYRRYLLDIVTPANYDFSGFGPWKDDLDSRLVPVWNYTYGGAYSALYKVE